MRICKAKSVNSGVAMGPLRLFKKQEETVKKTKVEDVSAECERFYAARDKSVEELGEIYEKALQTVAEEEAEIFAVHQIMLQDDDFNDAILGLIKEEHVNAEYAVQQTGENFAQMFLAMDSAYMQGRAADMKDISARMIKNLSGSDDAEICSGDEPFILFAEDLTPSETIQLDKDKILAFATVYGSDNSHTAILARSMGIPALIGVDLKVEDAVNGTMAAVDAYSGTLYVDPDEETTARIREDIAAYNKEKSDLMQYRSLPTETRDGRKIQLFANIASPADMDNVLKNGAEGIGLFRSEFLYLESRDFPAEDVQFNAYREVLEKMEGKTVIIRTLDIGADKRIDYLDLGQEENPAMGLRAIRICLTRPEIFKTQIRALLRASVYGNLSVMFPMITSPSEIDAITAIIDTCMDELKVEGTAFKDFRRGIMIETPAAAVISDILAEKVDFFSIGTNDLTQYTMAIDRQNDALSGFLDTHHEAILRLMKLTAKNAKKAGIEVGVCGELGCDEALSEMFLEAGFDELSMSPAKILGVRKHIREL